MSSTIDSPFTDRTPRPGATSEVEQLRTLLDIWRRFEATKEIPADKLPELEKIELRDFVFPDIKPELWAIGHF